MEKSSFKKILRVLSFAFVPAIIFGSVVNEDSAWLRADAKIGNDEITGVETDPTQYVGYGYNVISGKALYEADALMLNNPILDVNNPELHNAIKVFDGSKTEYQSSTSQSASEISRRYGETLSGGGGLGGGYASFSVDIGAKFNRGATEAWNNVASEEYSYYTIFSGNRPVILQMEYADMVNYLTPAFKKDILACKHSYDAEHLFNKYGTHLLTGYTLGGIFEMTNYYATNSNNYVKEGNTSFDAQVNIALGSFASGNAEFSFTNNYGYLNNNKYATNSYKCTTYGGLAFPGLTIDQAFSWYETIAGAGYVYQLWTDSINAGRNLVIVNIPQSSKMVPIWDLLPNTEEYADAKLMMMQEYQKITGGKYHDYREKYPDRFKSNLGNERIEADEFGFHDHGFNYSTKDINGKFITSHIPETTPTTESFRVKENSYIYMDYDQSEYVGQNAKWTITSTANKNLVEVKDGINGVFKVNELPGEIGKKFPEQFTAEFSVNGVKLFQRKFIVSEANFAGGNGSEDSPYLIADARDFAAFASNAEYWEKGKSFELINDIDLSGYNRVQVGNGSKKSNFYGHFNGNYHTIKNYNYTSNNDIEYGLFYGNEGLIENVNMDYDLVGGEIPTVKLNGGHKNISLLCGRNVGVGRIRNCTVKNVNISYAGNGVEDESQVNNDPNLRIGAIAAFNSGNISDCSVENVTISCKPGKGAGVIQIGMLAGGSKDANESNKMSEINKCFVSKCQIMFDSSKCPNALAVSLGGLAGYIEYTKITNCLVKNLTSSAAHPYHIDVTTNPDTTNGIYVGGFAGYVFNHCELRDCVVLNSTTFKGLDTVLNPDDTNLINVWAGVFAGVENDGKKTNVYDNLYCQAASNVNIFDGRRVDKLNVNGYNIFVKENILKDDYLGIFISDNSIWMFDGNMPFLNIITLHQNSLYLDTSETKTVFYKGEEFTYSNIKVVGTLTDGTQVSEDSVIVDATNFYDAPGNTSALVGNHEIIVTAFNKQFSYIVKVIDPVADHIIVDAVEGVESEYYVNEDFFDTDSVKVSVVNKNGSHEVLTYDAAGENGYTYEIPTGKYVEGNNTINIRYKNMSYSWNVDAAKRDIERIEVNNAAQLAKKEFKVGATDIDLSDFKGTVYYTNGTQSDITGKDCEFIYSRIRQGENTIIATYDVEHQATFKVTGIYSIDPNLLSSFILAVNEIDTTASLATQFRTINAANKIYKEIGAEYKGDAVYEAARTKLLDAIKNYNQITEDINTGFDEAIGITGSNIQTLVATGGFSVLALLISIVLKRG